MTKEEEQRHFSPFFHFLAWPHCGQQLCVDHRAFSSPRAESSALSQLGNRAFLLPFAPLGQRLLQQSDALENTVVFSRVSRSFVATASCSLCGRPCPTVLMLLKPRHCCLHGPLHGVFYHMSFVERLGNTSECLSFFY